MSSSNPIRGNVVRLTYNYAREANTAATSNFFELMYNEASAVSYGCGGPGNQIEQLHKVYYWRGAVLTHGVNKEGYIIEIQKDSKQTLNELVNTLESEMKVKFKKKTISKI